MKSKFTAELQSCTPHMAKLRQVISAKGLQSPPDHVYVQWKLKRFPIPFTKHCKGAMAIQLIVLQLCLSKQQSLFQLLLKLELTVPHTTHMQPLLQAIASNSHW